MQEVVEKLALALDSDDYETARSVLSEDITYEVKGETLTDPDAVVDSYRMASKQAHEIFDRVEYDHELDVDDGSGTYTMNYTDILTIGDETLVHHARQIIRVSDGKVDHIVNVEIPGERENVDEFLARHGRSR